MNDSNPTDVKGCTREDCPVNRGGDCIQDFENIEDCDKAIIAETKPREEFHTVNQRPSLSLDGMVTMLLDRKIPTASIIGAAKSGKTTFLAMLFHRFLRVHKGFNGHLFMDSETFLGLNEKLHYAVIKSNNTNVNMPRSSLQEEPVFHFKTKDNSGEVYECLWVDIPGEIMEQRLSRSASAWGEFPSLVRSTHVLLFLDLKTISSPTKRGVHVEQALDALANSIQSKILGKLKLMVAFSKADAHASKTRDQIAAISLRISTRFRENFDKIEYCELHSLGSEPEAESSLSQIWNWIHS